MRSPPLRTRGGVLNCSSSKASEVTESFCSIRSISIMRRCVMPMRRAAAALSVSLVFSLDSVGYVYPHKSSIFLRHQPSACLHTSARATCVLTPPGGSSHAVFLIHGPNDAKRFKELGRSPDLEEEDGLPENLVCGEDSTWSRMHLVEKPKATGNAWKAGRRLQAQCKRPNQFLTR